MKLEGIHTHIFTPLTGSTGESFFKRAKELGRRYFSYTDLNSFGDFLKTYNQCKKEGLKFVGGVEVLFKDTDCLLIGKTELSKAKYFKTTLYAPNQEAFKTLSHLSSKKGRVKTIFHNKNYKIGLWTWTELVVFMLGQTYMIWLVSSA